MPPALSQRVRFCEVWKVVFFPFVVWNYMISLAWDGNTLLAFIALGIAPFPVLFQLFGAQLRNNSIQ
jgi:hypothetical protein